MKTKINNIKTILSAALLLAVSNIHAQSWSTTGNAGTDTSTNFIGTTDARGIKFKANNQTRMYIDKGGKVGIGTSSPQTLLDVYAESSSCALGLRSNAGSSYFFMDKKNPTDNSTVSYRTTGTAVWQTGTFGNNDYAIKNVALGNSITCLQSNNYVGIGTTAPTALLDVNADAKINGLTIGRGTGNVSTNTAMGFEALLSNWSFNNTGIGYNTLKANTSGSNNTAIGTSVLQANTSGSGNAAVGNEAMLNNQNGNFNVALGSRTLYANTSGSENVTAGIWSMYNNTTGSRNNAYGAYTLQANTTGSGNTAIGHYASRSNTTGYSNVAVGNAALYSNTALSNTVAIGDSALYSQNGGNGYNTAVGSKAMVYNTTGAFNTALGRYALYLNTTGYGNIASGVATLYKNTTGFNNIASGNYTMYENTTGSYNTATGYSVLHSNTTGSNNTAYGSNAMVSNTTGTANIAIGNKSLFSNTTGSNSIAIGNHALYYNDTKSGNVAIGDSSLYNNGIGVSYSTHSVNNTAVGTNTLINNNLGSDNTALGFESLKNNTEGISNVGVGIYALYSNSVGSGNTANGTSALYNNTNGYLNCANGAFALRYNTIGSGNTATGAYALETNTEGIYNVATGVYALASNSTGNNNTAIGFMSGLGDFGVSFNNCTFVGYQSSPTVSRYNVTMLGSVITNAQITADNQIALGNTAITQIRAQVAGITAYSDARYKANVKQDVKGLDFIKLLKPVTYHVRPTELHKIWGTPDSIVSRIDHNETEKIRYTGFIAQDVEKAMNESGYNFTGIDIPKTEKETYTLRYTEFIMPMVKAIQELDATQNSMAQGSKVNDEEIEKLKNENLQKDSKIESLERKLDELKDCLEYLCNQAETQNKLTDAQTLKLSSLAQNNPNPFKESTTIRYFISEMSSKSEIKIFSIHGDELKTIQLTGHGNGQVELSAHSFSPGVYTYVLIVDGKTVDTKQMVITR